MSTLAIDIETYSGIDLIKSGVYAYAASPDFRILLMAYAFNDEPVQIVDAASGESLPNAVLAALTDPSVIKTAYNANFERTCIAKYYGINCEPPQWRCSAVHAAELGLPQSLQAAAAALGLEEQKDQRGKALIDYFSKPCKPTKANGGRSRNLPEHAPDKWQLFKDYCIQDVVVERAIRNKLSRFPVAPGEQKLWEYDQRINDRGVRVDMDFAEAAIKLNHEYGGRLKLEAAELTGVENPNSVAQLKKWVETKTGFYPASLDKEAIGRLKQETTDPDVCRVLEIRSKLGKTSVGKYEAMKRSACPDGRIRGLLQFYGAGRTGRWAGRIVQVQNLPQNHIKDLSLARKTLKDQDFTMFEMLFGNVPETLSELIRTALIPSEGYRFIVSDFSAIEARVIAWLAGEPWRLDVFRTHGKIYEASASQMFRVPIERIVKGKPEYTLRQKGKVAELALGYGGSVGAMISMGALKMGLEESELKPLVDSWRQANPHITALWRQVEKAALDALRGQPRTINKGIKIYKESGILFIKLPSGRSLAYAKPAVGENRFGRKSVTYMGLEAGAWTRLETFGGKLTENIVQAIARDCLAETIIRLEDMGYRVNFHVHDEVVLDVPLGESSPKAVAEIMGQPIEWAKDLPLVADAYECDFYMKA